MIARRIAIHAVQAGLVFALLALWWWITATGQVHPFVLPPPMAVLDRLGKLLASGTFWSPLSITMWEFGVSFVTATLLGLVFGFLISRRRLVVRTFDPLLAALYSVPMVLLLPLFVLTFGVGVGSKIALGFVVAFFPVVLSTTTAFLTVDASLQRAALSMGASQSQLFVRVLLPASLPMVLSGMRIALITSLLSILGAETIASLGGLGHEIFARVEYMQTAEMYAYLAITVIVAMMINGLALWIDAWGRRKFS